ncbi:dihydropteroate synthase-like protein [Methanoplanus sp. FWC-SCC4]|uniref:Dihydropteroate synthase-like protein n=1 Tax=Methanochimaera problematica TaxID=2609417 RepID=A0AA97FC23_9EURY|nr:dihydropteroate synthase-like protein [Methanoplanus sp. FWC-SCC4]WOF16705.1 dihydropteroate synthase-like protein [Methanoplanus sp. FWC-SCC4]
MTILLPTGELAYNTVLEAAKGFDVNIVVFGKIAAFLTPNNLEKILLENKNCEMVLVSGMCTADFSNLEDKMHIPIYRGPRHAADLGLVLRSLDEIKLSRHVPADEMLAKKREEEAVFKVLENEKNSSCDFEIKGLKIGGNSRIKVLAEIMDAHKNVDTAFVAARYFESGADIVDLGFGFDATPDDVKRTFESLKEVKGLLAADTQDPELIKAAIPYTDIILSLHDENMGSVAEDIAKHDVAAVIVPHEKTLEENIAMAKEAGIKKIIADPLLQPVGSGLVKSLSDFKNTGCPLFFGAGNVAELIDADSVGINALLAGMAKETGASVIFTSEHSDKTKGSIKEMKTAVCMMALTDDRPYPKDLGIDLFVIKEKRKRREPPLKYETITDAEEMPEDMTYDPLGNLRIGIEDGFIVAIHNGSAVRGKKWEDVFHTILKQNRVSLMDHAAYLGKELYKAELALKFDRSFDQDGDF